MLKLNNFSNFVLKDINLTLKSNQNLVILGDNGAGKTTLAKILSGVIENKNTTIDDKIIGNIYGKERTQLINYIPPKLEVFDEYLSVFEFLELSYLYGTCDIETVLKLLEISHLKNKFCHNLSSGEAQLLLIASGILHNATFTILDETSSNLDPQKQKLVFNILTLKNYLQTKIIITHNLNFAFKLAFDVLYLDEGTMKFFGSSEEFFKDKNLYKFFGSSVKNIQNNIVVDL